MTMLAEAAATGFESAMTRVGMGPWITPLIEPLVKIALLVFALMTAAAYLVLLERWIAAWVQDRIGPNRVGVPLTKIRVFGMGQPLADGLKFIFKEEFTPSHVDKPLYILAPVMILAAAIAIFAVVPFGSLLPPDVAGSRQVRLNWSWRRASTSA